MKYMKKQLVENFLFLIVGIGALIYLLITKDNNSVFLAVGCAFTAVGAINLIQIILLMKKPDKCEEIEIKKTEERNIYIREKTNSQVYSIFLFVECVGTLISLALGYKTIGIIFSILLLAKAIIWGVVGTINSKRY
ncbi:MAG: hypothetical protein PUE01_13280 [Clostridiaceae bacterium]|nr:hypothetical protein [Clostridiaceae bacterium]